MDGGEPEFLILGRILDIPNTGVIEGTSRRIVGGRVSTYDFTTDTLRRTRTASHRETGTVEEYSEESGRRVRQGDFEDVNRVVRTATPPFSVRLCYPLDLDIWGRRRDDWHLLRIESQSEQRALLHVAHKMTESLRGTLVFDQSKRLLTEWSTYNDGVFATRLEFIDIRRPKWPSTAESPPSSTTSSFRAGSASSRGIPPER